MSPPAIDLTHGEVLSVACQGRSWGSKRTQRERTLFLKDDDIERDVAQDEVVALSIDALHCH